MAALTVTVVGHEIPVGDRVIRTFRCTPSGAAAGTDWAVTGLLNIDAVLGAVPITTAGVPDFAVFAKNAQGTSVAEDTNPGDLGIEVVTTAVPYEITVLGKKK